MQTPEITLTDWSAFDIDEPLPIEIVEDGEGEEDVTEATSQLSAAKNAQIYA